MYIKSQKRVVFVYFLFRVCFKHAFIKICAEHLNKPRTKRAPHKRAVAEYALLGGADTVFLPFVGRTLRGEKQKKKRRYKDV